MKESIVERFNLLRHVLFTMRATHTTKGCKEAVSLIPEWLISPTVAIDLDGTLQIGGWVMDDSGTYLFLTLHPDDSEDHYVNGLLITK